MLQHLPLHLQDKNTGCKYTQKWAGEIHTGILWDGTSSCMPF